MSAASPRVPQDRPVTVMGSFERASVPGDLSLFLKDGVLVSKIHGTPAEQDGYSLYLALKAIERTTEVDYTEERKRLLEAVVTRRTRAGGFWTHGAWTGSDTEVHMRFTAAAIRLLCEALDDGLLDKPNAILSALDAHLAYAEELPFGTWFLHDSLELPDSAIRSPFRLLENQAWNSSPKNALVLNTHLDTLATIAHVLHRVKMGPAQRHHLTSRFLSGLRALEKVLEEGGGAWEAFGLLDGIARSLMFSTFQTTSLFSKAIRKAIFLVYFPLRQQIRNCVPGFVFRDGYLERDISLPGGGFDYHLVNIYDLARFAVVAVEAGLLPPGLLRSRVEALIDQGIEYAITSRYWHYLMYAIQRSGSPILLCEAMLARLGLQHRVEVPAHWLRAYCEVRRRAPPSAAILGYDPLTVGSAARPRRGDNWDEICLKNGTVLSINIAECRFVVQHNPTQ
jgi:hypothetical protein